MKSLRALSKMYNYENLFYYDNALYEHDHDHKKEKQNYTVGETKKSIREYHNQNLLNDSFSSNYNFN